MAKPSFIIADTDSTYLEAIEIKFLEELGDDADLHIITSAKYFEEYFSQPREASVLVVSRDMYFRELQKHNIENIVLLTDDESNEDTEDINVFEIYKYTNISDIYNRIITISSGEVKGQAQTQKDTEIVLICSAVGGAGNTTIALGLSECLAKRYKKILYINAETFNSFQYRLEEKTEIPNISAALLPEDLENGFVSLRKYISIGSFEYIQPFASSLISVGLEKTIYEKIVRIAKEAKIYDAIVVDAGAGLDMMKVSLMASADKVFIITRQSSSSVYSMNLFLKNINCSDDEKYYIICNDFVGDAHNALEDASFMVTEFVNHMDNIDMMKAKDFGKNTELQKLSYLIM